MGIAAIDAHPSILILILIVAFAILAVMFVGLFVTFKRFKGRYETVNSAAQTGNLAELIIRQSEEIQQLQEELSRLENVTNQLGENLTTTVKKTALIRFDAFDDVGGKLSFAVALLNDRGDGLVISSINGRQESRIYAKPVKGGESVYNLSIEEKEAIGQALR